MPRDVEAAPNFIHFFNVFLRQRSSARSGLAIILREHDIPCSPVFRSSKWITRSRGKYLTIGSPIKFSDLDVELKPSPVLGEHTDEVLRDLGYGREAIAQLHAARAV